MIKSIGFLSMQFEEEEKRDFRPGFFKKLQDLGEVIYLDIGYGAKLGFTSSDYISANQRIQFIDRIDVLQSDVVITIRTPIDDELSLLKKRSVLFSMLHFPTRTKRSQWLHSLGIRMISMDSIIDDYGTRMIQDFPGTVRNALTNGYMVYDELNSVKKVVKVLILGSGELGKMAVDYAIHISERPVIATVIGRSITNISEITSDQLSQTDILIDTTKRIDSAKYVITNDQIGSLPLHAVIIDISADDYDVRLDPIQVKAIEGIPTGNLSHYIFPVDDLAYERIPTQVRSDNRRVLISCNAWPGINPNGCLDRYEKQIEPFIQKIVRLNGLFPNLASDCLHERALSRGTYEHFMNDR